MITPAGYPPLLLKKPQVAYLLGIAEREVVELINQGKLTRVDDGGKWTKVRLADVEKYVENLPEKHLEPK